MHIFCDFDGTVSACDTTDLVLSQCADPAWEAIEVSWIEGRIDSVACMAAQISLIEAPLSTIDAVLDRVTLRDGFGDFLTWAALRQIPVTIVSDGVDYFINRVLTRHGIRNLRVIANHLVPARGGGWALNQPSRGDACVGGCGVCKCKAIETLRDGGPVVFVGDGRSDFCVATKPDLLFATAALERFCLDRAIDHRTFRSFTDVQQQLERLIAESLIKA